MAPSVEAHAEEVSLELQPGDVVALATDGVFDNLFDHELAAKLAAVSRAGPGCDSDTLTAIADGVIKDTL